MLHSLMLPSPLLSSNQHRHHTLCSSSRAASTTVTNTVSVSSCCSTVPSYLASLLENPTTTFPHLLTLLYCEYSLSNNTILPNLFRILSSSIYKQKHQTAPPHTLTHTQADAIMTRLHSSICFYGVATTLLLLLALANGTDSNSNSNGGGGGGSLLRKQQPQQARPRESVIRRLYGPENGAVRKHVRLLEEQSYRSRTGFLGDPSHKVPYDNHPYDPESPSFVGRRKIKEGEDRNLQDTEYVTDPNGDGTTTTTTTTANLYKPLRIKFETQALDDLRSEETAAKIDFIKTQILPKYVRFVCCWSSLFD